MTEVRISWLRPDLNDTHVPAEGSVDFRPTTRYQQGEAVVVDASRTTTVDGDATVTLAPTGPGWCWRVTHRPSLGRSWSEYVLVPDSDDVVEFMDLVRVDPESLEPDADPDPAWWGAVDEMIIGAEVVGDDLQLTRQSGETFDAGHVRGPTGPQGEQGVTGEPGPQGESGERGPEGPRGEPGADGADGIDGSDGQDGEQGPEGPRGPRGPQGETGPPGQDGQDGATIVDDKTAQRAEAAADRAETAAANTPAITISDTQPDDPQSGDVWFDTGA